MNYPGSTPRCPCLRNILPFAEMQSLVGSGLLGGILIRGSPGCRFSAWVRRRRRSLYAAISDRGATRSKSKSCAIRRTRAFRGVWRRCSLLIRQLPDGPMRVPRALPATTNCSCAASSYLWDGFQSAGELAFRFSSGIVHCT